MDKEKIREIVRQVQENHKRLRACPGPHDFVLEGESEPMTLANRKYRCTRCNGTIDSMAYSWYTKGLDHGRKEVC